METDNSSSKQTLNNSDKIISCIINPAARDGQSIQIWESVKNRTRFKKFIKNYF